MPDRIYEKNDIINDRYVVQHMLGAGNFSYVYKVMDSLSGTVLALKIFKEGTGVLDQIRTEYNILRGLNHEHIARVYGLGQLPDRTYYLELEFVEGITISSLLHTGRISFAMAHRIVNDLLDAMGYLHKHNVIHRDIKPNNIITNGHGAVIVDFNVSKLAGSHASTQGIGTPRYKPPEVDVSGWNRTGDLYAVGLVLYEMVTGHYPFDGPRLPTLTDPHNPIDFNPSLSGSLAQAIIKALAYEPDSRFQSAQEMLDALNAADWEPNRPIRRRSMIDLSLIPIPPDESSKLNNNPYLTRLLTLYSQSQLTNAGTRGLDAFARATYVLTRLDTELKSSILRGDYSLIMITGNAGDGKTAFIQRLEEEAERDPATSHFSRLPSGNGAHFVYNGRQFFTNYDGSQDEGDVGNDEVLDSFFQPYGGSGPFRDSDRTHLIAINEGRLVDFLQTRRADYPYLHRQVQDFFEQVLLPDTDLLIINLNLRAVIADGIDGISIFDQMVANLAAPEMWEKCQSCDIVNRCYAKFNVESLNDINYGPQIRHRLKTLFQIIHFRQRLHITIRDLRSALSYIFFNIDDCDAIHALLKDPHRQSEYLSRFYYNAAFPFFTEQSKDVSQDRLVRLLAQIDPGEVANPKLDGRLAFTPPNELSILQPFDIRSDYDRQLLASQQQQISQPLEFAALNINHKTMEVPATGSTFLFHHATLRRKVYFERVDEEWPHMLPYTRFANQIDTPGFLGLLRDHDLVKLKQVRDDLIYAISLSEGIYIPNIAKHYLCLRTSQEPKVTIKSFRRFHKNRFRCRVRDVGNLEQYIEYIPSVLILDYEYETGKYISMEISLDLYEMLYRIFQGYTPSLNELHGSYINLLIFKRQLAGTIYDEVLLTENDKSFYRVFKTDEMKLIITDSLVGEEKDGAWERTH